MSDKQQQEKAKPRWLPLESNPQVMNNFIGNLGMRMDYQYYDVFGFDEVLLQMVPHPVIAVMLLFPVGPEYSNQREEEAQMIKEKGQTLSPNVFSMKQTIGNACGTVGIIHSIGNNLDKIVLEEGSYLDTYFKSCDGKSREDIGQELEVADGIAVVHEESANEGQTEAPALEDSVDLHFIAFIHKDGHLYELDGNKEFPINHGETTQDTLLEDSVKVVKKFMARKPDDLRFTVCALAKADNS
eukprot:m.240708 g.240708  ORF g.240708 m.240708 type:complete len:242 (+) comp15837_c0_seq1:104-829(+)